MRRLLSILLLCLLTHGAGAAPVTPSRAREIAGKVLRVPAEQARMAFDAPVAMTLSADEAPAWYIFDGKSGGFVIVSGDDCLMPILGYSLTGNIDGRNLPPALTAWLEQVGEAVRVARKYGMPSYEGPVTAAVGTGGKLLILPEWDQDYPYNWYCPTITPYEEKKAAVGCVATAMGSVMRYYEWPPCGHGIVPDYEMKFLPPGAAFSDNKTTVIPGTELGHEYKWHLMPMSFRVSKAERENEPEPAAGKKQIAWLLYDCGLMLQSEYSNYNGTGAFTHNIPVCMSRYMYYSSDMSYVLKDSYSGNWLQMIKGEIDAGRPVIYGALNILYEGHQFLVTGYDDRDYLYVNWGWGGSCNGYFPLDNLYPYKDYDLASYGYTQEEIKEIENSFHFCIQHDAVISIIPDKSYTPTPVPCPEPVPYVAVIESSQQHAPNLYLKAGMELGHEYKGISVNGTVQPGSGFYMDAGLIHNSGGEMYVGNFRFDIRSWEGNLETFLSEPSDFHAIMPGRYSFLRGVPCTLSESYNFRLGDKICLGTYDSGDGVYRQVKWVSDGVTVGEIPLVPMYFISQDGGNHLINGSEVFSNVEWPASSGMTKAVITYPDGSVETIVQGY